jgi:V8-like Glu-specific endopeptidase
MATLEVEEMGCETTEFDEASAKNGSLAGDPHAPVSHVIPRAASAKTKSGKSSGEAVDDDEGAGDDEVTETEGFSVSYETEEEADESEFEEAEGWSAYTSSETESDETESNVDAWFASATETEQQEVFQFLAPLIPLVVKAAVPALAGAAAQHLPRAAGTILKQLGRKRLRIRRETDEAVEIDEATLEAMLQQIEVIIGKDDRVQIKNTKVAPWKRICHLQIEAANGRKYSGTGALIGRRTIATAGHCVFIHGGGGWAKSITVTPGRNGAAMPFGSCKAIKLMSVRGWTAMHKREYDYGAIIVPPNCIKMQPPSAFGFANLSDAAIKGKKLNLAGYPGDKPVGTMWYHGLKAKSVTPQTLIYDIDTVGGQSGSPVWLKSAGKRVMVGIHTNGALSGNSATRISKRVFENLSKWRNEGT